MSAHGVAPTTRTPGGWPVMAARARRVLLLPPDRPLIQSLIRPLIRLLPLPMVILLAACAGPAPRPDAASADVAYANRAVALESWQDWTLSGRLGISRGDEGGSGRIDWRQEPEFAELRFRGTLGQGAWRLTAEPGIARLELANGEIREAARIEELVTEATGWSVPVVALGWWVRGLSWPGGDAPSALSLNADGTPSALSQAGWNVVFKRYAEGPGEVAMPSRLEAESDGLVLKLAIRDWDRTVLEVDGSE